MKAVAANVPMRSFGPHRDREGLDGPHARTRPDQGRV